MTAAAATTAAPAEAPTATALPVAKTETIGALQVRRSNVEPTVGSYVLSHRELVNLKAMQEAVGRKLSSDELQHLDAEGFVLLPWQPPKHAPDANHDARFGRIDDMVDLLGQISGGDDPAYRKPENAVFISTDILLHTFHVLIDRNFQRIEAAELHPRLRRMTEQLFAAATAKGRTVAGGKLRESFDRVSAYLAVALAILDAAPRKPGAPPPAWIDEDDPDPIAAPAPTSQTPADVRKALARRQRKMSATAYARARAELDLVLAAQGAAPSPLWGEVSRRVVDYTQFKPRSHYTKSAILESYFRAMMWFGLMHFALDSPELTRDALVLSQLVATSGAGNDSPQGLWTGVYEPTSFFVGLSDDGTFGSYRAVAAKSHGTDPAAWDLANDDQLEAFCQQAVRDLPAPRVRAAAFQWGPKSSRWRRCRPQRHGLRVMGQRFIPDSYFFTRLTNGTDLPSTPTALMVMSVLGSRAADGLLDGWLAATAPRTSRRVRQVVGELQREVTALDDRTWGSTLYYGWLYALRPLLGSFGEGYPMFMRSEAWRHKGLLTALGSWTELRHDTLLYAKQSGAEKAGGDAERIIPPVPKGYVEPNLDALARLTALVRLSRQGLAQRKLLDERHQERFEILEEVLSFCTTFAEKELAGLAITDEEYERLRNLHGRLGWALSPIDADIITERDARAAIIADVHTDGASGRILYEATGAPLQILVAVKDGGGARLTRGAAYSYYEFTQPMGSRLTDEAWQERIYGSGPPPPPRPDWVRSMVAGQ